VSVVDVGDDCDIFDIYGPYRGMIAPDPLPAEVVLASATRCLIARPSGDDRTQRTKQVADTGLDALAAALRLPTLPPPPGCVYPHGGTISGEGVIEVTDVQGRHYLPKLPSQGCGDLRPEVVSAIDGLPWRVVATDAPNPTPIPSAAGSGCFSVYDTELDNGFFDLVQAARWPTIRPLDPTQQPLQVCRYDLDTDPMNAIQLRGSTVIRFGRLTVVSTLDGQLARDFWLSLMAAGKVTTACTVQAPFAVVLGGPIVFVELGGCYRAYVEGDNFLLRLDAATVAHLFGAEG
jgi:hypothetical protein